MTIIHIYLDKLYSTLRVRLWKSSSILLMAKNQPSFKYSLTFVSFWDSIVTPKKIKLDFDITPAKWILWFKIIPATTLQTTEWMIQFRVLMSFSEVPQVLHKMNSNLWKNWIAGGLFFNTPTRLGHFNAKLVV